MKQSLFSLLFFLGALLVRAQEKPLEKTEDQWLARFFVAEEALPLLMEAAISYSAEIERLDHGKSIANEELKLKRRELLSGLALGSGYSYGTRIGVVTGDQQVQNQINAFVLPAQAQYNVGLMMSLSLDQIFNRRSELHKQVLVIKQSEADRKIKERQIRQLVIGLYQDIVLAKSQLELHQEALQTANIHFKLAEKQFAKGEIQLSEMARISESYTTAATAYGTSKVKYATAILMMEELIGKKLQDLINAR